MIHSAMIHTVRHLNQHFKVLYESSEDIVVLSNIVEQDGGQNPYSDNKIVASLVNVEKESAAGRAFANPGGGGSFNTRSHPPVHLNLYIMFSANFTGKNYEQALKFLSDTIMFFQKTPMFTKLTTPDLPDPIEKLTFNIENLNVKDLSSLWSVISGKYVPSVLYKMCMITIDADAIASRVPTLQRPTLDAGPTQ